MNKFFSSLPFYEYLCHWVVGLIAWPVLRDCGIIESLSLKTSNHFILIFEIALCYVFGLLIHNFVEVVRSAFGPGTTKGKVCLCLLLRVVFARNDAKVIDTSRYEPNHDNHDYYEAYRKVEQGRNRRLLSRVEYQASFLLDLFFVIVLFFLKQLIGSCWSFGGNVIFFIILLLAVFQAQRKVYRLVWELEDTNNN